MILVSLLVGRRNSSTLILFIFNIFNAFLAFIPKLVAAGIIIAVGMFVAKIVKELLVPVLKAIKVDALQEKAGIAAEEKTTFSTIIANVVYGVIVLVVITAALDQLGIAAISAPANAVVATVFQMIPNILGAIVIIAIGVAALTPLTPVLESETLKPAFETAFTALFGALGYKYFVKDLKLVPLPLALTLILEIALGLGTSILIPVSAVVSTLFAYFMFKKASKKQEEK